jgi:hypothetical protein
VRVHFVGGPELHNPHFTGKPGSPSPNPRQLAVITDRDLSGWRPEDVDPGARLTQQPGRSNQRVAREGRLCGRQENPDATVGGIIDEDRFRKSELKRDRLATFLLYGGSIQKHPKQVAAVAIRTNEDAKDVQRGHSHSRQQLSRDLDGVERP